MNFECSRYQLSPKEFRLQRALEIVPGFFSWSVIIGMLALSWWAPLAAAVGIIAFDIFWLMRLFYMTIFLVLSYLRLSIESHTDWMGRLRRLADPDTAVMRQGAGPWRNISGWIFARQLRAVARMQPAPPRWDEIYHVILFPISHEDPAIIEAGLKSLSRQSFPPSRMLVVLAVEARAGGDVGRGVEALQRAYQHEFLDLLVIVHPDGLPGEARVKGANVTWAARAAAADLQQRKIPVEQVLISCFDADTIVSREYFACLTYSFLTTPNRERASFQPIPVYHNNIWEAPGFARVLDIGSSFFQLIEATNPALLVTFSSHSMSLKALIDVGYWPVDMISDDSAIFWKALIHYQGDYEVVPLPVTVSMDVVAAPSWWQTIASVYKQKRRWAWGAENVPLALRGFLQSPKMPWMMKLRYTYKLFEMHLAWATWPLLLTVIGWLPAISAGREFSSTVMYYSIPHIQGIIFELSSLSLLVTVLLSVMLLPKPHVRFSLIRRLALALEWVLVPFITVGFIALPALDAQTRLLMGKRMEFWVTGKRLSGKKNARMMEA